MNRTALLRSMVLIAAISLVGCKANNSSTDSSSSQPAGNPAASANGSSDSAAAENNSNSSSAPYGASGSSGSAGNKSSSSGSAASAEAKPIVVKSGTQIVVTADQSVSSKTSNPGDTFEASVAEPVVVGDRVVIPKGSHAKGTVVDAKSAGRFKGNAELTVALESVTVKGKQYRVKTTEVTQAGKGRGKRTAEGAGGGAVVGALVGALAGHGKGAAIGAAAGAGAGTAGAAMTGERDVTIDSESKLSFKLEDAVVIERK